MHTNISSSHRNWANSGSSGPAPVSGKAVRRRSAKRSPASVPKIMFRYALNPEKYAAELSKMQDVFRDSPATLDTENFEKVFGQPYPGDINIHRVAEFTHIVWLLVYSRTTLACMRLNLRAVSGGDQALGAKSRATTRSWREEEQLNQLERDTPALAARVEYLLACFERDNAKLSRLAKKYLAMAEADCPVPSP